MVSGDAAVLPEIPLLSRYGRWRAQLCIIHENIARQMLRTPKQVPRCIKLPWKQFLWATSVDRIFFYLPAMQLKRKCSVRLLFYFLVKFFKNLLVIVRLLNDAFLSAQGHRCIVYCKICSIFCKISDWLGPTDRRASASMLDFCNDIVFNCFQLHCYCFDQYTLITTSKVYEPL